jgi:hypothetical protein
MEDPGVRVPLIARWTGKIGSGQVNGNHVNLADFLPTLVDAARAQLPSDRIIDGHSFYHQLIGRPGHSRDWNFLHHWESGRDANIQTRWARNERYKLYRVIRWVNNKDLRKQNRLYDLLTDPFEQTNGVLPANDTPAMAVARAELSAVLDFMENQSSNLPPTVDCGPDLGGVEAGYTTTLSAAVTDDGVSPNRLIWSQIEGPGTATFTQGTSANTGVTFSTPGTYTLRLSAYDGFNSYVNDEITVQVVAASYETWQQRQDWGLIPPDQRGPGENPDGDSYTNVWERAFGLNPAVADLPGQPIQLQTQLDGRTRLASHYRKAVPTALYEMEWSEDLNLWSTEGVSDETIDPETNLTRRILLLDHIPDRIFWRLRFRDPPPPVP